MKPTLLQLNTSAGGMPKLPVPRARVTHAGVEGDQQRNRKRHGGPDRAICLFSAELYDALRADGIDLKPGSVGDNFTTRGLDLTTLATGDRLRVGTCLIELTKVREPCKNLNQWHPELLIRMRGRSGWMARVIEEAVVAAGDEIRLVKG